MKFSEASITPTLAMLFFFGPSAFVSAAIPPNCNSLTLVCPPIEGTTGPVEQTPAPGIIVCNYPMAGTTLLCAYSTTTGDLFASIGAGCPTTTDGVCATCIPGFGLDSSGDCTACTGDTYSPSGGVATCATCPLGFTPTPGHSNCLGDPATNCLTNGNICPATDQQQFGLASMLNGAVITCTYANPENAADNDVCLYDSLTGLLSATTSVGNHCWGSTIHQCATCIAGNGLDGINNCVACAADDVNPIGGTTCTTCATGQEPNADQSACVLLPSMRARNKARHNARIARKGLGASGAVQW